MSDLFEKITIKNIQKVSNYFAYFTLFKQQKTINNFTNNLHIYMRYYNLYP